VGYSFTARSGSILHVEDTGAKDAGSGPPVLALHGIGGGAYFFGGLARRLAPRHRVIALDNPGTGGSVSATSPFTLESAAADIADLIADKIGTPVTILGHSFGTMLALRIWETRPDSVRALIFACGLPKARSNVRERLSLRAQDIARHGIAGWGPKMSPGVFSAAWMASHPESLSLFESLFEAQDPAAYVRSIEVLLATDLGALVPAVRVPCAAIIGTEDSYAPPEAALDFIAKLPVKCRETLLEGCGHMPFYEKPEAFAKAVEDFLVTL
jgi:pimeloyl-ACP methyl ester carboxylesterase